MVHVLDPNVHVENNRKNINAKYCNTNSFSDFKYQNKDGTIIGVTYELPGYKMVSILFDEKNSLTIGELKIIMYELYSMWLGSGEYRELLHCTLESHPIFGTMSDDKLIPQNINGDYYFVDRGKDFLTCTRIQRKYVIDFSGKHCNYQCPHMILKNRKLMKQNNNKNNKNNKNNSQVKFSVDLNPFEHCPCFNGKYNYYKQRCPFKCNNNCPHYQRVIHGEQDAIKYTNSRQSRLIFNDKKHLYLYCHSPTEEDIKNINNDTIAMMGNKKGYEWYDYVPQKLTCDEIEVERRQTYCNAVSGDTGFLFIPKLIVEVIKNNFITDLLPKFKPDVIITKQDVLNKLETMIDEYHNTCDNINAMQQLEIEFEKLNNKFHHPRDKQMGYPLEPWHMLSIMLYCINGCNHDLCLSQRDGSYKTKWPVFDCLLNHAIGILSQFEQHWENIYTGICGSFINLKMTICVIMCI